MSKTGGCDLSTTKSDELWNVLQAIREAGGEVHEVTKPRPNLQDVFVRTIGEVNE